MKVLILSREAGPDLESIIRAKKHEAFTAEDIISATFIFEKQEPQLVFFDL